MKKKAFILLCMLSMCMAGCTVNGNNYSIPSEITVTVDFESDSISTETESAEVQEGASSESEDAVVSDNVNWQEVFEVPTDEEVAAYTNPNNRFAPCLAGFLFRMKQDIQNTVLISRQIIYRKQPTGVWGNGLWIIRPLRRITKRLIMNTAELMVVFRITITECKPL